MQKSAFEKLKNVMNLFMGHDLYDNIYQKADHDEGKRMSEGLKILLLYPIIEEVLKNRDLIKFIHQEYPNIDDINQKQLILSQSDYHKIKMYSLIRNSFAHGYGFISILSNSKHRNLLIKLIEEFGKKMSIEIKEDKICSNSEVFRTFIVSLLQELGENFD